MSSSSVKLNTSHSEVLNPETGQFDPMQYANELILKSAGLGQNLVELRRNIDGLDEQIKRQVSLHHSKLLTQATSIESLEGLLETLTQHICTLQLNAQRVGGRTNDLFAKTNVRTTQLDRLHETCNLIRAVIRVFYITTRIEQLDSASGFKDLPKAGQLFQELREILDETDLRDIDVAQKELTLLPKYAREIQAQSSALLSKGLQSQNQSQVSTALQALFNIKKMQNELEALFEAWLSELKDVVSSFSSVLQPKLGESNTSSSAPGSVAMQHVQSSVVIRANLWNNVERLNDYLLAVNTRTLTLVSVLAKKRDAQTHKAFLDEFPLSKIADFWSCLALTLKDSISGLKGFVKQALENEYPKLLRLLKDMFKRFGSYEVVLLAAEDGEFDVAAVLRKSFVSLEKAYLSKSLSRMFDSINLAFSADSAPTQKEAEKIVQCLSSELSVATFDSQFATLVTKNVVKTIKLFEVKAEATLATDGEASQVVSTMSAAQRKNIAVVNAICQFREDLLNLVVCGKFDSIREEVTASLIEATDGLLLLIGNALKPLFASISDAISAIIATIHQENFAFAMPKNADPAETQQCSLYLRELQQFILRVQADYLSHINAVDVMFDLTTEIARRATQEFIDHAVLVRPLGDGGRLRLVADFAQMELAVSPLCRKVTDLGKAYHLLRAIRPLLFESAHAVGKHETVGTVIPYSVAIHLIISMSPDELQSPHITAGWSVSRYSAWLNDHKNEVDRLQFLKGTLEAYARSVHAAGKSEYVSTYPLLLHLLNAGFEHS